MLDRDIDTLLYEIELLGRKDADIIFVLNDVNSGVIPIERESRRFIDYTGGYLDRKDLTFPINLNWKGSLIGRGLTFGTYSNLRFKGLDLT